MLRCAWVALRAAAFAAPALAQTDIVGEWAARTHEDAVERGAGPEIGEYAGMPVNAADVAHADAWQASLLTLPEHQCFPHPTDYSTAFTGVRISKDVDPVTQNVIAYHTNIGWMNPVRTIWMDGRPHPPPEALHTWEGFSTGKWEGDVLTVTTTHLKTGYVKRNGLARSDKATVIEHFIRVGNYLTWVTIVNDPVYLTEPLIRSRNYELDPGFQVTLYPCSIDVEVERPEGEVPAYLPGQNPALEEYAKKHNMPMIAVRGGAESMYPEFMAKLTKGFESTPATRGPAQAKAAKK
jgi:hypothetical protein